MPIAIGLGEIGWTSNLFPWCHDQEHTGIYLRPNDPRDIAHQVQTPSAYFLDSSGMDRSRRALNKLIEVNFNYFALEPDTRLVDIRGRKYDFVINRDTEQVLQYDESWLLEDAGREGIEKCFTCEAVDLFWRLDRYREIRTLDWKEPNLIVSFDGMMNTVNPNEFIFTLTRRMSEWWRLINQLRS
ncbi:MAG: hypothetical protein HZB70_01110 [Candidatus Berkelbacteria bacterium]|nr:MAG: hypothetical protein HZB70_01110 [Candidatus Berkelbacteria bacterium]QQG52062.1 MAG: hypothetical protein HY845_01885 [Candidatus Berkelbacteria bacterium]